MKRAPLGVGRPSVSKQGARNGVASTKLTEGEARIVVDVPAELHHKLKLKALEQKQTVKEFVLELLKDAGIS